MDPCRPWLDCAERLDDRDASGGAGWQQRGARGDEHERGRGQRPEERIERLDPDQPVAQDLRERDATAQAEDQTRPRDGHRGSSDQPPELGR